MYATCAANAACFNAPFMQASPDAVSGRLDKQTDKQADHRKLAVGRAVTLRASESGVLRVAQGRLWVTFNGGGRAGDYFVGQGEGLPLLAGQTVVVESFAVGPEAAAYFSWEPLAPTRRLKAAMPARWVLTSQ